MKMPDTHLGEEEGKEGISKTQLLSKTGFFFFFTRVMTRPTWEAPQVLA